MALSDLEIDQDTLQSVVESGFRHVGWVASIITDTDTDPGAWAPEGDEL